MNFQKDLTLTDVGILRLNSSVMILKVTSFTVCLTASLFAQSQIQDVSDADGTFTQLTGDLEIIRDSNGYGSLSVAEGLHFEDTKDFDIPDVINTHPHVSKVSGPIKFGAATKGVSQYHFFFSRNGNGSTGDFDFYLGQLNNGASLLIEVGTNGPYSEGYASYVISTGWGSIFSSKTIKYGAGHNLTLSTRNESSWAKSFRIWGSWDNKTPDGRGNKNQTLDIRVTSFGTYNPFDNPLLSERTPNGGGEWHIDNTSPLVSFDESGGRERTFAHDTINFGAANVILESGGELELSGGLSLRDDQGEMVSMSGNDITRLVNSSFDSLTIGENPSTTAESVFTIGNGSSEADLNSSFNVTQSGVTTLSNSAWQSDASTDLITGSALVVEGHTELKGNTLMRGQVTLADAQGDISMGIFGE